MKETESALKGQSTEATTQPSLVPKQSQEAYIKKLEEKAKLAIQMEADIKTVISVFSGVMESLGMKELDVSGGNIQSALPTIVGKLSREMMMGTFNTQALADIQAVMPIIEKYKHLADDEQ
jgi:hypothetical protein